MGELVSNTGWVLPEEKFVERDTILFGGVDEEEYVKGCSARSFEGVSLEIVKTLLEKGYIAPEESEGGPTVQEFVHFVSKSNVPYTFSGYATAPDRWDVRIGITGISANEDVTVEDMVEFVKFARKADVFKADEEGLFCLWDWKYRKTQPAEDPAMTVCYDRVLQILQDYVEVDVEASETCYVRDILEDVCGVTKEEAEILGLGYIFDGEE